MDELNLEAEASLVQPAEADGNLVAGIYNSGNSQEPSNVSVMVQPASNINSTVVIGNTATVATQKLTLAQLANLQKAQGINNIIQVPVAASNSAAPLIRMVASSNPGVRLVTNIATPAQGITRIPTVQNVVAVPAGTSTSGSLQVRMPAGAGLVRVMLPNGQSQLIRLPAGTALTTAGAKPTIRLSGNQLVRLISGTNSSAAVSAISHQSQSQNSSSQSVVVEGQQSLVLSASGADLSGTSADMPTGNASVANAAASISISTSAPAVPSTIVQIKPAIRPQPVAGAVRTGLSQPGTGLIRVQSADASQGKKIIYVAGSGQRIVTPTGQVGLTGVVNQSVSVGVSGAVIVRYNSISTAATQAGSNVVSAVTAVKPLAAMPRAAGTTIAARPAAPSIGAVHRVDIQQALDKMKQQQQQSQLKVLGTNQPQLLRPAGAGPQRIVVATSTVGGAVLQVSQQQLQQQGKQTVLVLPPGSAGLSNLIGTRAVVVSSASADSGKGILVNNPGLGAVQVVGMSNAMTGGSQTFYVITNSNTSTATLSAAPSATLTSGATLAALTAPRHQRITRLVQPGGVMVAPGSAAQTSGTRVIALRGSGGKMVQLIPSAIQASGGVQPGTFILSPSAGASVGPLSQNQLKANKIIAEAIAKAQASGDATQDGESGADTSKRKRKRKADEDEDTPAEGEGTKKRKPAKPRPKKVKPIGLAVPTIGFDGLNLEGDNSMIDVVGGEVVVEGEGGGVEEFDEGSELGKTPSGSRRGKRVPGSRNKKRKVPKFMKQRNKKRKKAESDSDASDAELKKIYRLSERKKRKEENLSGVVSGVATPTLATGGGDSDVDIGMPNGSLYEELVQAQTRRSGRSLRKKYVDEVDLELSDDNDDSDDDDDDDDDVDIRRKSRKEVNKTKAAGSSTADYVPAQYNSDMFQECPEEDAHIVEKILGARLGKRRVPTFSKLQQNNSYNGNSADNDDDIDVEGHDSLSMNACTKESMKEIQVEEYYVKYKNFSYLHCEWKTADELAIGDKRIASKIKRFHMKWPHPMTAEVDELDLFNQDYIDIDRVLDVAETVESSGETVVHYLVTWRSLPYEDATWELEQDVDREKIDAFLRVKDPPPPEERYYKARPSNTTWESLTESPIYKNDNVLRDYQLEGINWLNFCYYNRQNCILADEMGLGKTVQSITFLKAVYDYGVQGPFLIIVPLSTVGNWQREFEAWTDMNAIVYHGTVASRSMIRQYEMYFKDDKGRVLHDVYKFHALITTYEVIITDFDELSSIDWRVAIIDEAHRLKNRNCKLLQGLSCFDLEHRVLLTGTPLQNNVDELFSLLSFLEPKQFSSLDTFMAEFGKLESESQVDKLKALLKPMMLRRLKEDVEKTIAPKEETIVEVELTNIQKKYYRAILERNFSFLAKGSNSASNVPNLMNTMMELRKCCNHPYLINGAEEQIWSELRVARYDAERVCQAMVQASGKLVLIDKLLPKLMAGGHKILIFSQMIRVLDILEDYLIHKQILYERIDGRKRGNVRQEAIDRFSRPDSDRFVFLLCTRAGGLGINLTAADTVIIYDSDWNPQNDLQAQARCHRIGQQKSVKVYRLITRNTYEREMFDRASLKLGLDKAVLQSTARGSNGESTGALSKKEVEDLLKRGAYGVLMDEDNAGEEFCEEDIDHILQRRTQVIQIESGVKGSTFAKASFNVTGNRSDINIDDPNFWQKWAKKAEFDADENLRSELILDMPRQRKSTARYGTKDHMMDMSELDSDNSDPEVRPAGFGKNRAGRKGDSMPSSPVPGGESGGGKKKKKKKNKRSRRDDLRPRVYSRSDCFKVEKNLLVFGWGRWSDILTHGRFKHKLNETDIITITRAMLLFSLQHYEGDERIKQFIYDLISPTEDGLEKDCKNHTGLSAPVPRGRKGKKVKKDSSKKFVFDEDLTKLDIDVERVLHDENYRKHLKRQAHKVLLRVRLLYYLKQEVIGSQADKIFDGVSASEIDVPVPCGDVYTPVEWWDTLADKCLLVGVFKHGYEKYNQMRQDESLCFLSRCGPPDNKALQAEQEDDDDIKEELDDDDDDLSSQNLTDKKKEVNKKKQKNADSADLTIDDSSCLSEGGKLPFPNASDLNTRFRRIITSFQRSHKQGMMKLEQVAKKMHKREQMTSCGGGDGASDSERRYIGTAELQNINLEGVGGNPLLLAEQLHWTRREEAEFYRVVSTYGVERDVSCGQYVWGTFRTLTKLERKLDDTLTEYFKAFYFMCLKVCHRLDEDARPPNGLFVMPVTEERASRCLARIDLLNKVREVVLHHPNLDERLALCQASSYLPDWWQPGVHDKDLLIGAAKHGVAKTEEHIQFDPELSFCSIAESYAEMRKKEENKASSGNTAGEGSGSTEGCNGVTGEERAVIKSESSYSTGGMEGVKKEEEGLVKCDGRGGEVKGGGGMSHQKKTEDDSQENGTELSQIPSFNVTYDSLMACYVTLPPSIMLSIRHKWSRGKEMKMQMQLLRLDSDGQLSGLRLENICQCVETGRWRLSRRHLMALQAAAQYAAAGTMGERSGSYTHEGLMSAAVGGGHDYSMTRFSEDGKHDEGWPLKLGSVKRRHRRTKAEMELARSSGSAVSVARDEDSTSLDLSSSITPSNSQTNAGEVLSMTTLASLSPDAPVNVVHSVTGYRPPPDARPTYKELTAWLHDHPDFVVDRSFYDETLGMTSHLNQRHHHHRHRRPRLDPHKLDPAFLTGDEKVAVINRHTCKKISGSKAPLLKELNGWLQRNPGFDVDYKWEHIVKNYLPETMYSRIQEAPPYTAIHPSFSSHEQSTNPAPDLSQPINESDTATDSQSLSSRFSSPITKNSYTSSGSRSADGLSAASAVRVAAGGSRSAAANHKAAYMGEGVYEEVALVDDMEYSEEIVEYGTQPSVKDVTLASSSFSDDEGMETSSVDDTERYDDYVDDDDNHDVL